VKWLLDVKGYEFSYIYHECCSTYPSLIIPPPTGKIGFKKGFKALSINSDSSLESIFSAIS
jgi:hypothetical protein